MLLYHLLNTVYTKQGLMLIVIVYQHHEVKALRISKKRSWSKLPGTEASRLSSKVSTYFSKSLGTGESGDTAWWETGPIDPRGLRGWEGQHRPHRAACPLPSLTVSERPPGEAAAPDHQPWPEQQQVRFNIPKLSSGSFQNQTSSSWSFLGSCQASCFLMTPSEGKHFICWVWLWLNETEGWGGTFCQRHHSLGQLRRTSDRGWWEERASKEGRALEIRKAMPPHSTRGETQAQRQESICSRSHSSLGEDSDLGWWNPAFLECLWCAKPLFSIYSPEPVR